MLPGQYPSLFPLFHLILAAGSWLLPIVIVYEAFLPTCCSLARLSVSGSALSLLDVAYVRVVYTYLLLNCGTCTAGALSLALC